MAIQGRRYTIWWMESSKGPGEKFLGKLVCTLVLCTGLLVSGLGFTGLSGAADVTVDLSAGHTSNPAKESNGQGSGFSEYSASLYQEVSPGERWSLGFLPVATYQDLWDLDDNYTLGADVTLAPKTPIGYLQPGIFARAHLYRDHLVEADERHEFSLGARVGWFVSARSSLSFEASWKSIGYLSDSAPLSHGRAGQDHGTGQRPGGSMMGNAMQGSGMMGGNPTPGTPMHDFLQPVAARDDQDLSCNAAIEIFILPNLTGTLTLDYGDLNSSLDMESYRQLTPSVNVVWLFMENWHLALDMAMQYRNYYELQSSLDTSGQNETTQVREMNKTGSMVVELRRFFDSMEVFARFGVAHGEYPLNDESYTQRIIQCGISLSY